MDLPRLIVLRIWADPAHFRAVARELESGQTHSFSDPVELLDYLRASQVPIERPPPNRVPPGTSFFATPALPSALNAAAVTAAPGSRNVQVICLDLEGVLVPEIWIEFSKRTGIAAFARTTRDEPDYDKLMRYRIGLLEQHGLKLPDIQHVIGGMQPMDGARAFLDDLRARYQVLILSDTFYEFADPLMQQLGRPTLFCHRLVADATERVVDYQLRQPDQKRQAVNALRGLNFKVMAVGDSYNDTAMLGAAHAGFFIHPPAAIAQQFPQFPVTSSYAELTAALDAASTRLNAV